MCEEEHRLGSLPTAIQRSKETRGEAHLKPTWLMQEQRLAQVQINQSINQSINHSTSSKSHAMAQVSDLCTVVSLVFATFEALVGENDRVDFRVSLEFSML